MSIAGTQPTLGRLRLYNILMGTFHFFQGIVILALSNDFALPITAAFLEGPPGTPPPVVAELFSIRIGWAVAAFIFLSAGAHYLIASPRIFQWYRANLARSRNYARWIEYSVSSSLMMAVIAMLPGVTDVAALLGIFFVNAAMILFGLVMEHYEQPGNPNWMSYWFGSLMGIVPWVAVGIYLFSPGSDASPPGFVYAIYFSIFVFFNVFAINMVLQYKRVGPWRDYLFGESAYIMLSLVAKSLLAWQVFAGTLVPEA
ncbi:MAG: heliorhodopsin HeR [Chloroflexi bacterium]|nr:heliorhodopsin HeR [Chloroflexota bacterium]MDA1174302.1 heliorhodopsin HeR [Chloroflexota bacterium]